MTMSGNQRTVHLAGVIGPESSQQVKAELLALDHQDPLALIDLDIDSPGGSVLDALAIIDTINNLHAPVHTVCRGLCVGAAAMVFAAGKNGSREASDSAIFMFPEISAGGSGNASELQQQLKSLQGTQNRVTAIFATTTGHSEHDADRLFSHGKVYSGSEAKQAGLVDRVLNI